MNLTTRRWIFRTADEHGAVFYLRSDGHGVDEADADEFIGTEAEACAEAERRADAFDSEWSDGLDCVEPVERGGI